MKVGSRFDVIPGHLNEEKLIAIRWRHAPLLISLADKIVSSRIKNRFAVINTDMVGNSSDGDHTTTICNPGLVALCGCSKLQHVFLFFGSYKTTFERHGIIPDPERWITGSATRTDQGSACIVWTKFI